jgi:type I restriction enzyme R subunit
MSSFTESIVEDAALAWLEGLGYAILHGPNIAVGIRRTNRRKPRRRY